MSQPCTRRDALAGLGTLAISGAVEPVVSLAATATAARAAAVTPPSVPPVARLAPVSETIFGETIVDPYRWMEDAGDPDWQPFMSGHAAHTRAVLDSLPGRAALLRRVSQLSGDAVITRGVQLGGARLFFEQRPRGASNYKLFVRDTPTAAPRVLVDPTTMQEDGRHVSMDWWSVSPDGRHVAVGLSPAGSELADTRILEVGSGQWLPERLPRTPLVPAQWLPDGTGFFGMRLRTEAKFGAVDFLQDAAVWLHRLRTDPAQDVKVLARGLHAEVPLQPEEFPFVGTDASSQWVLAATFGGVRRENPYFTARLADLLAGRPAWRRVCTLDDEVVTAAFRGDELYLLSTRGAENGKVLRTSMSAPSFAGATTVVPEGGVVIDSIAAARDGLYVQDMDGGYGALRRLGNDGRIAAAPLPFEGSIEALYARGSHDGAWFSATSWLEPRRILRYDPVARRALDAGLAPRPPIDTSKYEAIRSFVTARDGTRVPLSIVAPKDLRRDGSHPVLVESYGSYQVPSVPAFNARGFAFLEAGGVLATAHVRGGGEYGKRWWKAGQKRAKPNTWRDLIDCCEALVRDGWTRPARLAIIGASAGGITVGRALTERPDLFTAVISGVGVSNALRAEFSQNGPTNVDEFGTIRERDGFLGLKAMDAYQSVRDGIAYPAVLLTTGMTDLRVPPWMAAKMTARLSNATASGNPVLLRVTFDAGHGIGSTRTQADEERADEYAFVLWRAGAPGFQPKAP